MSDWTSNEAREFLSIIRGEAEKVVKDFGDRQSSVYSCLAVVTAISASGDISVRLLSSSADGSQDFVVRNRSGSTLEIGDSVWLHYWSDYTNVYIAMRNEGGDVLALPYDAVSSNLLINGGFDVWQRGVAFASPWPGSYLADRWCVDFNGSGATRAISRQAFVPGQTDVPNNPTYYLRFAQSVAGSGGTYNVVLQRIENVLKLSGQTVTLSFYARANSARNITTQVDQNFGSGGSSTVYIGEVTHALTTSWQLFTRTVALPSVSGKTIGANSFCSIYFIMPVNTTFTIDIANVQLNYGSVALPFVPRSFADELRLCQRYYIASGGTIDGRMLFYGTNSMEFFIPLPVTMRTNPTLAGTANENYLIYSTAAAAQPGFSFTATLGSAGASIAATKNSHGLTDGFFRVRSGLDAEL